MPNTFSGLGITFQYPDNWRLDEEDAVAGRDSVTVYGPEERAFWTVSVHPPAATPARLVATALQAMKEVYDSLDSEEVQETLVDQEMIGYDMNFFCLDLTNSAVVRGFRTPQASYVILYQAEDRDFEQLAPIFQAMTVSLLTALGRGAGE
jgi:hypothetical protein